MPLFTWDSNVYAQFQNKRVKVADYPSIFNAFVQISINSLAPKRFEYNFRQVIIKLILVIEGWTNFTSHELHAVYSWMHNMQVEAPNS